MAITELTIDTSSHAKDGLLLHARDGNDVIDAFIGRRVLDRWANHGQAFGDHKSFFREEYNAIGTRNLAAIGRLVDKKYGRGIEFNRQHPFVEILYTDIVEGGEVLDVDPEWAA
jgi:hypothetical protein